MNVIAYVSLRPQYFQWIMPRMRSESFHIAPVNVYDVLNKLGDNYHPDGFASFWQAFLDGYQADVFWSWGIPDEITSREIRKAGIPMVFQEFFGRHPFEIPCLIPFSFDLAGFYDSSNEDDQSTVDFVEKNQRELMATIPFGTALFSERNTLMAPTRSDFSGNIYSVPYWFSSVELESNMSFMKTIVSVFQSDDAFNDWEIRIRPRPRDLDNFRDEIDYVKSLNDERIVLDFSDVTTSLSESDLVICLGSNFGCDAIRAGCEVISYEGRSFFSHPQLVRTPRSPAELYAELLDVNGLLRTRGKRKKPFLDAMVRDFQGPLSVPCEAPFDPEKVKRAIHYALTLPRRSTR